MALPKSIVYILRSEQHPRRYYTGLTSNLSARLDAHNSGQCSHTASGRPWIVDVVVEFSGRAPCGNVRAVLEIWIRRGVRDAPSQMTRSRGTCR